ncbi:DnaB-like helicase C-terminal domain-containing protein, partial [Xylella fastidiosa]|uniref:DnaB-like helicase C-terminal domain-containing protein n=1 Tax=Xylella fastidiosa TaxID=2371 RepID=UPI0030CEDFD1
MIVIDQFDKLVPERIKENDSSNLKSVSIDLNNLAKELDVAVVCLIQLNGRKRKPDERLTKDDVFGTSCPNQLLAASA